MKTTFALIIAFVVTCLMPVRTAGAASDPLVGFWLWQVGKFPQARVEFRADGTTRDHTNFKNAKWTSTSSSASEHKYVVSWEGGSSMDAITLSFDRNKISGMASKMPIAAERIILPTPDKNPVLATEPVMGRWLWKMGQYSPSVVEIHADGTVMDGKTGTKGEWMIAYAQTGERVYLITWNAGTDHNVFTLSSDHNKIIGKNDSKTAITAERIADPASTAGPAAPANPSGTAQTTPAAANSGTDPIVGRWAWARGETAVFYANGSSVLEKTTLTATWQFLNNPERERKYRLIWANGRFINQMTIAQDGQSAVMVDTTNNNSQWNVRKLTEKGPASPANYFGTASGAASASTPAPPPDAPPASSELAAATAEIVKTYRNSLVFVRGADGAGSGFIASIDGTNYLVTNAHVAAGVKDATFTALDGSSIKTGAPSLAVGHDIFRMQAGPTAKPFEIMKGVDENAGIGDDIVVLGNAEGAGVINTITGKIVGLGPNLVELNAPFVPGNSGSPIIHVKTGKVIGVATYVSIQQFDATTKEKVKKPIIRRFGYRLDSVKSWQAVNWAAFNAQADEMQKIETLTDDLIAFLRDLADDHKVTLGMHTNPVLKGRIDAWIAAKSRRMSVADRETADANMLSFLKVASQTDVNAARARMTYDYFQRGLADQQQTRTQIADILSAVIRDIR